MKKSFFQAILWVLSLNAILVLSGCGGGAGADNPNNPATQTPAILTSISITPTTPSILQGGTQQFTATGTYSDNSTGDVTMDTTWTSTNTSNATITSAGLATGIGIGTSTIEASLGEKTNATQLTVTATAVAPTIPTQPANRSVAEGQTATFTVVASGTAPLSYQWRKNGTNIAGATTSSYTTSATAMADDGATFSVVVSNTAGSVTSNNATLTVTAVAPTIPTQPANRSVVEGQTATFTVVASGTAPLSYQWRKNGTNIAGATTSSYTTSATAMADDGATFSVVVSNTAGSVTSNNATLTVTATPVVPTIPTQPANRSVAEGQTATFTVVASGTAPLSYQWRKNGTNIAGATTSSYTTSATAMADDGATFSVVVSNTAGSVTSNNATLTVTAVAPAISTQPANRSVAEGQSATFNVTATGTAPLHYQWVRDRGTNDETNVGDDSSSYTISSATAMADDGATFSVVVTNDAGSVTSNSATLTVTAASSSSYVADHNVATEVVLRAIPDEYINTARTTLHVAYFHTSHGTHVSYGAFGLPGFKTGDDTKFGISNTGVQTNKLDFHDYYGNDSDYDDLSMADANWPDWLDVVRAYLDNPANAAINVMMWSWCDIAGHLIPDYLSSMQTLIDEYGSGGSKIGTGVGQRTIPVTFIFMTGHANVNNNTGPGNPREQAALITDYCDTHEYYCIDYYSIDTHTMDGIYYEDTGDDGNSASYFASVSGIGSGSFYKDWQDSHTEGMDWYQNRSAPAPNGSLTTGAHNNQHITANRKAFAFWWVLAKIAGY